MERGGLCVLECQAVLRVEGRVATHGPDRCYWILLLSRILLLSYSYSGLVTSASGEWPGGPVEIP